jgi:hypothetical protein
MCCVTNNLSFKNDKHIHGEVSSFPPKSFASLPLFFLACEAPLSSKYVTTPFFSI